MKREQTGHHSHVGIQDVSKLEVLSKWFYVLSQLGITEARVKKCEEINCLWFQTECFSVEIRVEVCKAW